MVKLVRLTSNDSNAIFDNTFKNELFIKPNSKIALKSISVGVDNKSIIINEGNDDINFQLADTTGIRNIKLTHAEYSASTAPLLFNDMNIKFNATLDTSTLGFNKDIGVEIKNSVNAKTTKFQIDFNTFKLDEYFEDINKDKGPIPVISTLSSPNKNFRGPAVNNPAPGEYFFYNNINICKGGGVFRVQRNLLANSAGRHGIIGFMNTNPDELPNNTALDVNKIIFGIVINDRNGVYQMIKNGAVSQADANIQCQLNDVIEIGISKGQLVARIYNAAAQHILNTDVYNFNNLFPVVEIEKNNTTIGFNLVRYTPNPYNKKQLNITPLNDEELGVPPQNKEEAHQLTTF